MLLLYSVFWAPGSLFALHCCDQKTGHLPRNTPQRSPILRLLGLLRSLNARGGGNEKNSSTWVLNRSGDVLYLPASYLQNLSSVL